MGRNSNDHGVTLPPRVQAAFDFLNIARWITEQDDASIPKRPLTALERNVETAALRTIQHYLLGEMDFVDAPLPSPNQKKDDDDNSTTEPANANK